MSLATNSQLKRDFRQGMALLEYVIDEVADVELAGGFFREMNKACHRLVPKYLPGHTLFIKLVTDAQLPLWQDFARENRQK